MTANNDESTHVAPLAPLEEIESAASAEPDPALVFVDVTGRRQRLVRYLAYGLGSACLAYPALVGVSFADVSPQPRLPFCVTSSAPPVPIGSGPPAEIQPSRDAMRIGQPSAPPPTGRPAATDPAAGQCVQDLDPEATPAAPSRSPNALRGSPSLTEPAPPAVHRRSQADPIAAVRPPQTPTGAAAG